MNISAPLIIILIFITVITIILRLDPTITGGLLAVTVLVFIYIAGEAMEGS